MPLSLTRSPDPREDGESAVRDAEGHVRYQWLLRVIGAYLDAQGAFTFSLIEGVNGFSARYQSSDDPSTTVVHSFLYEDLEEAESGGQKRRRGWFNRRGATPKGWIEDLLRALGYELEEMHAYSALLDMVGDQLLITYQDIDPTNGYVPRKRMAVMGTGEREALLQEAYARRGQQPA